MTTTADRAVPPAPRVGVTIPQYSRGALLRIWGAATVPMAVLAWVVAPILADELSGPGPLAQALLLCLTAGLVWQFVLVVVLVAREQGTLRWRVVREALWLRAPRSPRTGRSGGRLWWLVVPLVIGFGLHELVPMLPHDLSRDFGEFLGSTDGESLLRGAWGWFGVIVALFLFNTVLGEELLFRGFLLPRMNGAFGRADWAANGLLFAAYHLHVPWVIPATLLDTFVLSYPAKRYRSALLAITVHSVQSVFLTLAVLTLVL